MSPLGILRPARALGAALLVALLVVLAGPAAAAAPTAPTAPAPEAGTAEPGTAPVAELSWLDAVVLGVVEGITEYLPVSSTGHLVVTERLLDIGQDEASRDAMKAYTVIIQVGAIAAVLILYRRRIADILAGLVGRSETGRRLLVALVLAFTPAVVLAKAFEGLIQDDLLEPGPVAVAWAVGGVAILVFARRFRDAARGLALETITPRQALIIGVVQALALWPGTSRSLVTILAALAVGLRLGAAVEFSFLLGLATLGAATAYELVTDGVAVQESFGLATPALGVLCAFVSAAVAVRWMVDYLNRHDLSVFGWYRLAAAAAVFALLATSVI